MLCARRSRSGIVTSLTGRVIVATRVPVAIDVGVQVHVTVGDGAFVVAVGEIVAVEVFGGVVPVNVGDSTVVGTRVIVLVGAMVGLAGGCVGGRLVGPGVFVLVSMGEGATVCVAVAT